MHRFARILICVTFFFLTLLLTHGGLQAISCGPFCLGRHVLWVGPEAYHVKRFRHTGSHQAGWLGGIRACLERDELDAFYSGVEAAWAKGRLKGESGSGNELESDMTNAEIEGRLGYTFSSYFCFRLLSGPLYYYIRPIIGIGYFHTENKFWPPTSHNFHFTEKFPFGVLGVMTRFWCNEYYSVGLNVKIRQMYEAKNRVTGDPDEPPNNVNVGDRPFWVVEVPLNWYPLYRGFCAQLSLTPFGQFWYFGGREGSPEDFLKTRYWIYGLRLTAGISF